MALRTQIMTTLSTERLINDYGDYGHINFLPVLDIDPKASNMLDKQSLTAPHSQPWVC